MPNIPAKSVELLFIYKPVIVYLPPSYEPVKSVKPFPIVVKPAPPSQPLVEEASISAVCKKYLSHTEEFSVIHCKLPRVAIKYGLPDEPSPSGIRLSTVKVVLGPAPASVISKTFEDVPAGMLIPSVPSPVIPFTVTIGLFVVLSVIVTVPSALPVLFNVISPVVKCTVSALL